MWGEFQLSLLIDPLEKLIREKLSLSSVRAKLAEIIPLYANAKRVGVGCPAFRPWSTAPPERDLLLR